MKDQLKKLFSAEKNSYIMINGNAFSTGKGTNARFTDLDGDGLKDLVCGVHQEGVIWLKNKGTESQPSFGDPTTLIFVSKEDTTKPFSNITVEVVDLNGDHKKDLLVGAITSGKKEKIWLYYRK